MQQCDVIDGLNKFNYSKPTSEMAGKRIGMFSFGSGMCSTFYSITIRPGEKLDTLIRDLLQHVPLMLENRRCTSTVEFETTLENRQLAYNKGSRFIKVKHSFYCNVIYLNISNSFHSI